MHASSCPPTSLLKKKKQPKKHRSTVTTLAHTPKWHICEQRPQCTAGRQELWHKTRHSYLITDQLLFLDFPLSPLYKTLANEKQQDPPPNPSLEIRVCWGGAPATDWRQEQCTAHSEKVALGPSSITDQSGGRK